MMERRREAQRPDRAVTATVDVAPRAMRGITWGIAIAVPLWVMVATLVQWATR
jgi:hypothetical protein